MAVIYQITNMVNGKYYIGSAESFERRMWQHKYDLKKGNHKNPHLQASWNKHGEDAFVFEVIKIVPEGESTFEHENTYLHVHVGKYECYNVNTDAIGMRTGIKLTNVTKEKISVSRKGKTSGENHYRYGTTVSDEVKAKIGAAQKGVKKAPRSYTEEGMAKIRAAAEAGHYSHWEGRSHTEESKEKMSRPLVAMLPDRTERVFKSLTEVRDTFNTSIATLIRACKSGNPIAKGVLAGWVLSYQDEEKNVAPVIPEEYKHLPRSRSEAKAAGAKQYFTGIPCDRGHISLRATKGTCIACRREDEKQLRQKE
jgi:group I intron endonuclease